MPALPRPATVPDAGYAPVPPHDGATDWAWFLRFLEPEGSRGAARLAGWDRRRSARSPGWGAIRAEFESFRHEAVYRITPRDVQRAHARGTHALDDLRPSDGDPTKNFSGDVPFLYIAHKLLEEMGTVPSWADFRAYLEARPELVLDCLWREYGIAPSSPEARWGGSEVMRAFQWRIGCAFYSFIREVQFLAHLRHAEGLPIAYHFLLDAEWSADLACGDTLVELYVPNRDYKDEKGGRKDRCREVNPSRRCLALKIEVRPEWGRPWLVSPESARAAAATLRANLAGGDGLPFAAGGRSILASA